MSRRFAAVFALAAIVLALAPAAYAHEERASQFPAGDGSVPTYRTQEQAADVLVVCKKDGDTAQRIARMTGADKHRNTKLFGQCQFEHIQAAVDAVTKPGTNIYVLPGTYREEPSHDENAACTQGWDGGALEYADIVECGEIINLITVAGDSVDDPDIACDNALCDLQIEGTGATAEDVVVRGGFKPNGDWVKHNGIKADRADGFYLRNMTFELFRENAIYVHETDGYVLDDVVARYNDLYGILTFTSDHGLISDCDTHHNGDSGVYPGSAADVNADNASPPPLTRWAVEITGCSTHHNALGFSGTAGNSVYFHDNDVWANSAGYVTDSFIPNHPGMPQDHAWLENNRIHGNNTNYYKNVQGDDAPCKRAKPADRGYEDGVVCPAFPVPVGTGVMIAGGNRNLLRANHIYDNWRTGAMLFWVPAALREEFGPVEQIDTSNGNEYRDNIMGRTPEGLVQPNGMDFWWDDQGLGNCWQGNVSATGAVTHNATSPAGLPDCDSGGSVSPVGNAVKSATLVPCATYDREDNPDPDGCDWFDDQQEPAGRQESADASAPALQPTVPVAAENLPAAGGPAALGVLTVGMAALLGAGKLRQRRSPLGR
ncbi:MAG TPA: right-handed parallel beta-helix repeat-containing protein [Egibacteraceae bacterium]|nr:right-handed parallel beta-helix repeat-containing protein [Egibacteraceae bacterium]